MFQLRGGLTHAWGPNSESSGPSSEPTRHTQGNKATFIFTVLVPTSESGTGIDIVHVYALSDVNTHTV